MRRSVVAAAMLLAACRAEGPAAPDPAVVATLAAVYLAEARAEQAGRDTDSARAAALTASDATPIDLERWLDRAARDPAGAVVLWEAVGDALDSARTVRDTAGR
jgi:hypothetical protein